MGTNRTNQDDKPVERTKSAILVSSDSYFFFLPAFFLAFFFAATPITSDRVLGFTRRLLKQK
jgi:hypothetical protein